MPPFTARRADGKIVLEIDEARFVTDATRAAPDNFTLVNCDQFLAFALENVFTLTHDLDRDGQPSSWWLRLGEALAQAAAATNAGMRRMDRKVPTCACDPEEHDGG